MVLRIDPGLAREISRYGGETVHRCFNCGNCTAVCALSRDDTVFPRKYIRFLQVGARDKIRSSVDPWLCYYCGGCSDTCPRQAEPGELMMASRRWLTSVYDWTGLSRLLYRHPTFEIALLLAVAAVVLLLFTVPQDFGFRLLSRHPEALESIDLHRFAPKEVVHWGDMALAGLLSFLLLTNAGRMAYFVMKGRKVPPGIYLAKLKDLVVHALTQKRWRECEEDTTRLWLRHLLLVTGYGTMFLLVVVFLHWFQVEGTGFHWTSLLGYYSTLILLGTTSWMFLDRLKKADPHHKHSHLSDWLFLVLLFLTALTGVLLHISRLVNLALPTYLLYTVHLMVAVPMLVVEVPFGKWAHLFYRPLAVYLAAVRGEGREEKAPAAAAA